MNYYSPYFTAMPYTPTLGTVTGGAETKGLLSRLFGGGKFSSFINGTQKTLNVINQAIPLIKQVSPVVKNAKTMFKVMNEFKKVDTPTLSENLINKEEASNNYDNSISDNFQYINKNNNGPTFFL